MAIAGVVAASVIQIRIFLSIRQFSLPQAILVLGGGKKRELAVAQLAAQDSQLKVWVSSGLLSSQANAIFLTENVSLSCVNLDYSATNTVANFTTLVAQLQANNIQHIYLVTSNFHMRRSQAIAFWVLGSHGIAYTPVVVPSNQAPEPYHKVFRDVARSWLWLLTGRTGSSLDPNPPVRSS